MCSVRLDYEKELFVTGTVELEVMTCLELFGEFDLHCLREFIIE
jgi:hypothetical protein